MDVEDIEDELDYNSADEHGARPLTQAGVAELAARQAAFEEAMKRRGFALKRVAPDGNCLFRAVSEAVYGDAEMHAHVRELCVAHMRRERDHFARYVTEDFGAYLARKAQPGVHGNHVEMQALCELFCRPILVHSDAHAPADTFAPHGQPAPRASGEGSRPPAPIHLLYEGGTHFNALLDLAQPAVGEGLGLAGYDPRAEREAACQADLKRAAALSEAELLDDQLLAAAAGASEQLHIEAQLQAAGLRESLRVREGGSEGRQAAAAPGCQYAGLPPAALELIAAGYGEDEVVGALTLFGDDHASLLCYLAGE